MKTSWLLISAMLAAFLTISTSTIVREAAAMGNQAERLHEMAAEMQPQVGEGKFKEAAQHTKICFLPGPCFKKKLVCPKKCSKLPGEGGRRLVKDHFPGQCVFNCKKCIAHC